MVTAAAQVRSVDCMSVTGEGGGEGVGVFTLVRTWCLKEYMY